MAYQSAVQRLKYSKNNNNSNRIGDSSDGRLDGFVPIRSTIGGSSVGRVTKRLESRDKLRREYPVPPPSTSKDRPNENHYGTLDSAYETGSSTYNTVDSTYTLRTTGNGFGRESSSPKWLEPTFAADKSPPTPGEFERRAPLVSVDSGDTDTETETETDTELPKCSLYSPLRDSEDDEDMSYVPDYIRPVGSSPLDGGSLTPKFQAKSASQASSPSSTPSSSALQSRRNSRLYRRSDSGKSSYAGYREEYIKKQQEQLSGKKSLQERLKSLESGASVKLEVCRGSQKRQRSSLGGGSAAQRAAEKLGAKHKAFASLSQLNDGVDPKQEGEASSSDDVFRNETVQQMRATRPDIIESHRPADDTKTDQIGDNRLAEMPQARSPTTITSTCDLINNDIPADNGSTTTYPKCHHSSTSETGDTDALPTVSYGASGDTTHPIIPSTATAGDVSTLNYHTCAGAGDANRTSSDASRQSTPKTSSSEQQNRTINIKWRMVSPDTRRKSMPETSTPARPYETAAAPDATGAASDDQRESKCQRPTKPNGNGSKLKWKELSPESIRRLKELETSVEDDLNKEMEVSVSVDNSLITTTPLAKSAEPAAQVSEAQPQENLPEMKPAVLRTTRKSGAIQRHGAPTALTIDVETATSVVPVELRSPRSEQGWAKMREKRNARVFVLPSSDDSSGCEHNSRHHQRNASMTSSENTRSGHVAPVKFVPSVLRRNYSRSLSKDDSQSSSASSLVNATADNSPSKLQTSNVANAQPASHERMSSQSPRRSAPRRTGSRSRSSHEPRSSPLLSTNQRPPRQDVDQPHGSRSKSRDDKANSRNHSQVRRREKSSSRSQERSKSPRSKSKAGEYAELSNIRRMTSKQARNYAAAGGNLPSPRQRAVADAVVFGFPSADEGEIPYIDDGTGLGVRKKPQHDKLKATTSDGHADPATCRKMLPLATGTSSSRGRARNKHSPHDAKPPASAADNNRRGSYNEAMESTGTSDDVARDTEESSSQDAMTSEGENRLSGSKLGRSASADSILSTTEPLPDHTSSRAVKLRKPAARSRSADRSSAKGVHRRSYLIATTLHGGKDETESTPGLRTIPKRQPSNRKLKKTIFNAEIMNSIGSGEPNNNLDLRRTSRSRSVDPTLVLDLSEDDENVVREGYLNFKVATIDKGKRTSAQKSWKLIWAILKEHLLYLCKDWNRLKQIDSVTGTPGSDRSPSLHHPQQQPPNQLFLEDHEPLDLLGSLVSIAYNYVKRRNVFKITTGNGSEYLLQADDRDDMLAWISAIQACSNRENGEVNEDLILKKSHQFEALGPKADKRTVRKSRSPKPPRHSMAVPVKDVDGSRRFKWRGSVNKIARKFGQGQPLIHNGTFDVHLEDCPPSPTNELVPFVVDLCCRLVEERGLTFTGIYRVPGNSGTLTALQEDLNIRGAEGIDLENDERLQELNVVSSLLKSFFRKLPDPLFTNELYDDFITMNRKKDPDERLNGLRRLVHMLPGPHYETLKYLVGHLRKVADHSDTNKMEVRNLAIVFGPTLVRSSMSDNMATMVTDMSDQCRIVESILQHAAWFFVDDDATVPQLVPADEKPHEPVPNIDHLLANVGRTPGDNSDSTSESSKSKNSFASEKESFSRDVIDLIFGKRSWKHQQQQATARGSDDVITSSDDEFGFKAAERRKQQGDDATMSADDVTMASSAASSAGGYKVARPAASQIRAEIRGASQQVEASDIPARLYDFYVEHLDRIARADPSRPLPSWSSSTDTSPQVTPRNSLFAAQQQQQQQGKTPASVSRVVGLPVALQPAHVYGESPQNRRFARDPLGCTYLPPPPPTTNAARVKPSPEASAMTSSPSTVDCDVDEQPGCESDSDTSIFVGETLEEKLKNLTNLNKKLERRPSRRHRKPCCDDDVIHGGGARTPPARPRLAGLAPGRKLTAPASSQQCEVSLRGGKTTRELYHERKLARQQHRDVLKASRRSHTANNNDQKPPLPAPPSVGGDLMTRCVSDENVFRRGDPKRAVVVRQPSVDRSSHRGAVQRRHTLGAGDFPHEKAWLRHQLLMKQQHGTSMHNIVADPRSAVHRLQPKVNLNFQRLTAASAAAGRKSESYL